MILISETIAQRYILKIFGHVTVGAHVVLNPELNFSTTCADLCRHREIVFPHAQIEKNDDLLPCTCLTKITKLPYIY